GNTIDQGGDFAFLKPFDAECIYMRLSNPWRLKFWSECDDQQHAKGFYSFYGSAKRLQARGVDPMNILEDHQHWISLCQGLDLFDECFQCPLSALLREHCESRIASVVR